MAQRFNRPEVAKALGQRVNSARRAAGLTVEKLAKMAGVHHSSVVRLERGSFQTLSPSVRKICTALALKSDIDLDAYGFAHLLSRIQRLLAEHPQVASAIETIVDAFEADRAMRDSSR